jgi:hypothetical protein
MKRHKELISKSFSTPQRENSTRKWGKLGQLKLFPGGRGKNDIPIKCPRKREEGPNRTYVERALQDYTGRAPSVSFSVNVFKYITNIIYVSERKQVYANCTFLFTLSNLTAFQ